MPQSTRGQIVQSGANASGYTLRSGQEATADGLLTDGTTIDIPACLDRDIAYREQLRGFRFLVP